MDDPIAEFRLAQEVLIFGHFSSVVHILTLLSRFCCTSRLYLLLEVSCGSMIWATIGGGSVTEWMRWYSLLLPCLAWVWLITWLKSTLSSRWWAVEPLTIVVISSYRPRRLPWRLHHFGNEWASSLLFGKVESSTWLFYLVSQLYMLIITWNGLYDDSNIRLLVFPFTYRSHTPWCTHTTVSSPTGPAFMDSLRCRHNPGMP